MQNIIDQLLAEKKHLLEQRETLLERVDEISEAIDCLRRANGGEPEKRSVPVSQPAFDFKRKSPVVNVRWGKRGQVIEEAARELWGKQPGFTSKELKAHLVAKGLWDDSSYATPVCYLVPKTYYRGEDGQHYRMSKGEAA